MTWTSCSSSYTISSRRSRPHTGMGRMTTAKGNLATPTLLKLLLKFWEIERLDCSNLGGYFMVSLDVRALVLFNVVPRGKPAGVTFCLD